MPREKQQRALVGLLTVQERKIFLSLLEHAAIRQKAQLGGTPATTATVEVTALPASGNGSGTSGPQS